MKFNIKIIIFIFLNYKLNLLHSATFSIINATNQENYKFQDKNDNFRNLRFRLTLQEKNDLTYLNEYVLEMNCISLPLKKGEISEDKMISFPMNQGITTQYITIYTTADQYCLPGCKRLHKFNTTFLGAYTLFFSKEIDILNIIGKFKGYDSHNSTRRQFPFNLIINGMASKDLARAYNMKIFEITKGSSSKMI